MKYFHNFEKVYQKLDPLEYESFEQVSLYDHIAMSIQRYVSDKQTCRILVLGCGLGKICHDLSEKKFQVTGIDLSPKAIEIAKKLWGKRVEWLEADATQLNLQIEFDVIIDNHLLHCLVSQIDRVRYFQTVKRHLLKGGIFVGESMVREDCLEFANRYFLDSSDILWSGVHPAEEYYDMVECEGSYLVPVRKLVKGQQLEAEFLSLGLKLEYFTYRHDLKICLQGLEAVEEDKLPGVIRFIAT